LKGFSEGQEVAWRFGNEGIFEEAENGKVLLIESCRFRKLDNPLGGWGLVRSGGEGAYRGENISLTPK